MTEFDVRKAIQKMMKTRHMGPFEVAAEMLKTAEGEGVEEMTAPLRVVAKENKFLDSSAGALQLPFTKKEEICWSIQSTGANCSRNTAYKAMEKILNT